MWIKVKLEPYDWFYVFILANALFEGTSLSSPQPRQKLTSCWMLQILFRDMVFTVTQGWLSLPSLCPDNERCQQPFKSTRQALMAFQYVWNPWFPRLERTFSRYSLKPGLLITPAKGNLGWGGHHLSSRYTMSVHTQPATLSKGDLSILNTWMDG